jgi:hypothetical protein
MVGPFWWFVFFVWLTAMALSVPLAFGTAYFLVTRRFESSWQRVVLTALLGFVLAPVMLYTALFLPVTLGVVVLLAFGLALSWVIRRRRLSKV